ncbi:hypothetical protein ACFL0G_03245 [Candidatus Zixiibacteriota bacterium]
MKTGVSYYGNRIPRHVQTDMEDIAGNHCTYVVHTMSENDLQYYHGTIKQIVEISHQAGLEVWLDPWGVGRVFGGEAYSRLATDHLEARQILSDGRSLPAACFNQPIFREYMRNWTRTAIDYGADVLFWDEPHFIKVPPESGQQHWSCRCQACQRRFQDQFGHPLPQELTDEVRRFRHDSVVDFLQELCQLTADGGCKNAVCFLPAQEDDQNELAMWDRLTGIKTLDIIGTDPYWWSKKMDVAPFVGGYANKIASLAQAHGKESQLWVQNFMITPETEEYLRTAIKTAYDQGIRNIAAWSYWGAGYMAWLRSEDPQRVWQILGEEYARLHALSKD